MCSSSTLFGAGSKPVAKATAGNSTSQAAIGGAAGAKVNKAKKAKNALPFGGFISAYDQQTAAAARTLLGS
jgi:hypothetical protein